IEDVCRSSSKSTAFIPRSFWGSELTLLLVTKLLQRPIYLVVTPSGLADASYQIFKPIRKVTSTDELMSAGEFNYGGESVVQWLTSLQ
ncbi:hypothetical protein PHYSODRAFT_409570, partial [Phytophthora sojae]